MADEGGPTLCAAVSSGDTELVSAMLTRCEPEVLDAPDNRGFSPLMCACEVLASSQLTRMLIKRGANINYVSVDSGLTPLLIAAKTGNTKALHVLLDKGASVTARDGLGRTCLHWACVAGSESALQMLLRATGPSLIDVQDGSGYTPLMTATEYGRDDLVKALLAAGADKGIQNKVTHVAFDLADWYGHKRIAELLSPTASSEPLSEASKPTEAPPADAAPPPADTA